MKNLKINQWLLLFFAVGAISLFTQCQKEDTQPEAVLVVDGNGNSQFNRNAVQNQIANLPKEPLSSDEESGLQFMREEEKLAHDVYVQLYDKWSIPAFNNIAQSELTHTEAVRFLLDKYELSDPVGNNEIGVFSNPILQSLYDSLTLVGFQNEIDALKVGGAIEEIDILDLENQMTEIVDNQDILLVYHNLQKGSRNHLRAFAKNLNNRGVNYEPQYLSTEDYQSIMDHGMEKGGN